MMTLPDTLNQSFNEYEDMQERHIKSYSEELSPDIRTQNFERDKIFENLKNDLTNMLHMINKDDMDEHRLNIVLSCKDRIKSILDEDRILRDRLNQYRDRLIKHLGKLGHGKRALKGYMDNCNMSYPPRFMDKSG